MRLLIEANLPRTLAELVSKLGHDVHFARDVGLGTAPDHEIAAHALKTGAAIVTRDLDFADIRQYPPERYSGIVVLRVPGDATARYMALSHHACSSFGSRHCRFPETRLADFRPSCVLTEAEQLGLKADGGDPLGAVGCLAGN